MKTNLTIWLCAIPCLCVLFLALQGCTGVEPVPQSISEFKEISIIEQGIINGYGYTMFLDKRTGHRIMAYQGRGMIVLPSEKPELQ